MGGYLGKSVGGFTSVTEKRQTFNIVYNHHPAYWVVVYADQRRSPCQRHQVRQGCRLHGK